MNSTRRSQWLGSSDRISVSKEERNEPSVIAKGVMKRGMVVAAQIATKPHQRAGIARPR